MTADEARLHLRYSTWASRLLLEAALQLDPEKLRREMSVSHKNVHDTLAHIYMADRIWLHRILGAQPASTEEALESAWPGVQDRWREWSDGLTDADLLRTVSYKSLKGEPFESPVWQIVLHVVNHGTLHRGQVMAMLRQLDVAPPPTDLIFFYRTLG
jgi:uncharacterized damage-inducible protein DinB